MHLLKATPPVGVDLGHMHDLLMFIGIMIIMLSFGMPTYNGAKWKSIYIIIGLCLILIAISLRVTGN